MIKLTNTNIKYLLWVFALIVWNFGFPIVPPLYDVLMAIILKQIFI